MSTSSGRKWVGILLGIVLVAAGAIGGFFVWRAYQLPGPGDPLYEKYAEAFEVGTAALDAGNTLHTTAEERLTEAIELIPQEPAAWANRGLLRLRQNPQDREQAAVDLGEASRLKPGHPEIEELLSHLAEANGKVQEAIEHQRKAVSKATDDPRRLFWLAELIEKGNAPDADAQRLQLFRQILELRPNNLPALTHFASLAARLGDSALKDALARLERSSAGWQGKAKDIKDAKELLERIQEKAKGDYVRTDLSLDIRSLDNLLKAVRGYSRDASELKPPQLDLFGSSVQNFLRLTPLRPSPDEPDLGLTFEPGDDLKPAAAIQAQAWDWAAPFWLDGRADASLLVASARQVRRADGIGPPLPFPSGPNLGAPSMDGILPLDWNNDQRTDLLLAGAGGLRLFRQDAKGNFQNVTSNTKLPREVLLGDYWGAWAADVDMDGDADVLVALRHGGVRFLRNNFDDTFTPIDVFPGVTGARALVWADFDNDGAPDAALLDEKGLLHVFINDRGGLFHRREVPDPKALYAALAVLDVKGDGRFALVALRQDGNLQALSDPGKGRSWEITQLGSLGDRFTLTPGEVRLQAIDLDGNGAIDLVLRTRTGGAAWLADGKGGFLPLEAGPPPGISDIFPIKKGQLGLIADEKGKLRSFRVVGTKEYHFDEFRLRANPLGTDQQRLNSFALGSEAEVRTGSLIVKQPVDRPVTHFGLGRRDRVDVLRIVWATGAAQYELGKPANEVIRIDQRLTGSCPFLFGWDGRQMAFVSDFCWSSPLGMYINAQQTGGVLQTTDWIKVRGDQLEPREGLYDLRVSATLWETDFLDHLALMVVDHPPDTEMHVDERFFLTPTPPRLYLTGPSRPVARAWDHHGKEVTEIVKAIDGNYLDRAGRGRYQGVAQDHWVEVDPGELPGKGPLYLLAHGWIHPTDSSINFALEQGKHDRPRPLTLEVPDGKGGWKQAGPPLGFPAGKNKTLVIRIDGLDGSGVPPRLRLRTNLEIFWDALHVARGLDENACRTSTLLPRTADLRHRGILHITQANRSSPELPHYDDIAWRGQFWRDLEGFYTRFGDVRELLEKVDDRYVIMNAGDELRLTFPAPPAPAQGWQRDFVWICDGWTKDGNLNTRFSKTVLPLPYHALKGYDTPPGRLHDDPVYKRFPRDWDVYHTRYVTPAEFEQGLRTFRRPSR